MSYSKTTMPCLALVTAGLSLGGACSGLGESPPDAAGTANPDAAVAPSTPPTLDTGVDPAALSAALTPVVAATIRAMSADLLPLFGFTSPADADHVQLGRPYGQFVVHKGPWLEFLGTWSVPVSVGSDYCSIVGVQRDGASYKMIAIGSAQLAPTLTAREKLPGVSAALDRGRAGLLRRVGDGGDSLLAYETVLPEDALQSEIRVQSLGWYPSEIPGIDGSAAPPESSLTDIDKQLPPE